VKLIMKVEKSSGRKGEGLLQEAQFSNKQKALELVLQLVQGFSPSPSLSPQIY
jgi:hypothetical protein